MKKKYWSTIFFHWIDSKPCNSSEIQGEGILFSLLLIWWYIMLLMKYVRTGFRRRAEYIHLGNPLALYTAVGYRWPWFRFSSLIKVFGHWHDLPSQSSSFRAAVLLLFICSLLSLTWNFKFSLATRQRRTGTEIFTGLAMWGRRRISVRAHHGRARRGENLNF